MYTVLGTVNSRCFRVLWALEELGLKYEHVAAPPHSDAVRKQNVSGKIPVLMDGDTALTDSVAIVTYLADKHGQLTFSPGTIERAKQDAMTGLVNDEFDALIWSAAKHSFVLPEELRHPEVKNALKWEYARNSTRLGKRMGDREFVMGDKMTIPDIVLTHCLGWAIVAKFGVEDPVLSAYLDRMRHREAYERARKKSSN